MAYRLARAGLGPAGAVSTVTAISWMGERASTQATSRMATRSFQNRLLLHNKQFYSMERHQQRFFSNSNSNTTKPNPPTATATATATTEKAAPAPNVALQSKSFMKWYEGHLQASPVKTKMVTGSILWGIGDGVAQLVPHMAEGGSLTEYKYDYPRTGRAALFGFALHAPTSHVHFNFLEWMTHKVGVTGLGIPVFKTIMEQFVYWSWISNSMYHGAMGAMQGMGAQDIYDRIGDVLWETQKAQWVFWIPIQLINFQFTPVRHQLNVVLLTSIVWTALLSAWYPPAKEEKIEAALQD